MTSGKRLALLLPDLGGGGAERVALTLMQGFVDQGHTVDLVLVSRTGQLLPLVPAGVEIVDLHATKLRHALRPLIRYLRRRRPHALHAMMWPLTIIALIAKMIGRVQTRIVVSDHIALSRQYGHSRRVMRAIRWSTSLLYPLAAARILVSKEAANDLASISWLPRSRIDVIYNPLDLPAALQHDRDAADWGDSEGDRIVTLGVLKEQKNQALLLRAFAMLRQRRTARLAIVGDGALLPMLKQLADDLAIAEDVIFAGYHLDPWPWLASADVFALSSDYEGFGNVLVEALYAGLTVVSTDCESGPREILDNGLYGQLVACGDPVELASAMEAALKSPSDPAVGRRRALELSGHASIDRHLAAMLVPPP